MFVARSSLFTFKMARYSNQNATKSYTLDLHYLLQTKVDWLVHHVLYSPDEITLYFSTVVFVPDILRFSRFQRHKIGISQKINGGWRLVWRLRKTFVRRWISQLILSMEGQYVLTTMADSMYQTEGSDSDITQNVSDSDMTQMVWWERDVAPW